MKVYKIGKKDAGAIGKAVNTLADARKAANDANKALDAAKEIITRELESLRGVRLAGLPEGETVVVEIEGNGGVKIDRKGTDRIDIKELRAVSPDVAEQFTRRTVSTYFEPLN